ncbi:phage head closure protein [Carboxylicivirga sp. N1Y132]|uniref:Phage head closure protein n=1 Tax=Carboxylicivirga marina TaxID=2800988 RepID=A0ABS1HGU7_9BACT|nr:phage head closure protein [Carboxylicivirga marina]
MRHRIELLSVTTEKVHGEIITNTTPKTIRCFIHKNIGSKSTDNNEVFSFNHLTFTIRNQFTISKKDRFKYDGEEYQIEHMRPSYDRRWLDITIKKINT